MKYIQSKIKFIILSCFIVVFTGCSQSAFKHFDKKDEFVQNVQYTKVVKLVDKGTVKAIATITYLNSSDSSKWDNGKQNFIIGTYIIDKNKDCCVLELSVQRELEIQLDTTKTEYEEIVINSIEETILSKTDPIYETIPLRNNWAEYKLVSYDDKEFEDIKKLTFKLKENREQVYNKILKGHNLTTLLFWSDYESLEQEISFTKE